MSELTPEEQEKVLLVAQGLLAEPENWVVGRWKCKAMHVVDGKRQQKTDANGKGMFQYCIEGAVNQAIYDALGEERALELGAVHYNGKVLRFNGRGGAPALDINRIARDLMREDEEDGVYGAGGGGFTPAAAMAYNDSKNPRRNSKQFKERHKGVLKILQRRLDEVRALIKK